MRGPSVEARNGRRRLVWHPAQAGSWSRRPSRLPFRAFPGPCWRGYVSTATINSNTCTRTTGWSDGLLVVGFSKCAMGHAGVVLSAWPPLPGPACRAQAFPSFHTSADPARPSPSSRWTGRWRSTCSWQPITWTCNARGSHWRWQSYHLRGSDSRSHTLARARSTKKAVLQMLWTASQRRGPPTLGACCVSRAATR